MSLEMEKVLVLWKTSCLIPLPKLGKPVELNDYRPLALIFHIMKTLERLLICCMRMQVAGDLEPSSLPTRKTLEWKTILYMLHRAYAYLDVPASPVLSTPYGHPY